MKIATMVRGYIPAPRPAHLVYAPIDLAMALSEGLQQKGHSVTYYGPVGSKPPVKLRTMRLRQLVKDQDDMRRLAYSTEKLMHYMPALWDMRCARDMFERARAGEFDVLHFHHPEVALPFAPLYPDVPVVYTLHDPIADWMAESLKMHASKNQFFVSISDNQKRPAPDLPYIATVYNGVHLKDYQFCARHKKYLMFAGRIVPEKGVAEAVQVALKAGCKLLIAGPIFPDSQAYFDRHVQPFLNDDITYLGYVKRDELAPIIGGAKAFLMPINWEEPFGVTMIEAMASGTPVIAYNRGSVPEVVKDGVTGFIVSDLAAMARAVERVDSLSRAACRKHVEDNFSVELMVRGYEDAFRAVVAKIKG